MIVAAADVFDEAARAELRVIVDAAGGRDVFAIGRLGRDGRVERIEHHASGTADAVNVVFERVRGGEVLTHHHPDGRLEPSAVDLSIAARAGATGCGFWIVDHEIAAVHVVVRPGVRLEVRRFDAGEVDDWLGPQGRLAAAVGGFEYRAGQHQLAHDVAQVFDRGGFLLAEAGTGIGKSFAYLVPALAAARRGATTVLVSTASIALQEQLMRKDIPALARASGAPVHAVLLKGRGNYVSLRRAEQFLAAPASLFPEIGAAERSALRAWLETTPDGDRAGLPAGVGDEIWEHVQSEGDNCLRARCPQFGRCHFFNSRRAATGAAIIVVNHALLAADVRVRNETGVGFSEPALLPAYAHLVVDEAHALEGYVRGQFGARVSELSIARTLRQLFGARGPRGALVRLRQKIADRSASLKLGTARLLLDVAAAAADAVAAAETRNAMWFDAFAKWLQLHAPTEPLRLPAEGLSGFAQIADGGLELARVLDELSAQIPVAEDISDDDLPSDVAGVWVEVVSRARRAAAQAAVLRAVLSNRGGQEVAWAEFVGRRPRPALEIAPVDVGHMLSERLWPKLRSAILTSATLTTGRASFAPLRRALGVPAEAIEREIASPFPYAQLVRLGIVRGLGVERSDAWAGAAGRAVVDLVVASDGRALVLLTSHAAVRDVARVLRSDPRTKGLRVLAQGEDAAGRLAEAFRQDHASVLVGTSAFWEGFDAGGETLRHVIIGKLPFAVPTHPLEIARHEWAAAVGLDPFRDLAVPEAVMRFRQGFGRLVRSADDWGAVSVLDDRILTKAYGRRFLEALPELERVEGDAATVAEAVRAWFQRHRSAQRRASRIRPDP